MQIEIPRKRGDKKPIIVEYNFGANTAEAVAMFNNDGPYGDVVHRLFIQAACNQMRHDVRELLDQGGTPAQVLEEAKAWKPSIKHLGGRPPLEKATEAVKGLTPEEKRALIKQLQEAAG